MSAHPDDFADEADTFFSDRVRAAYRVVRELTPDERSRALCWFCPACWRHIGPGWEICPCKGTAVKP